MTENKPDCAVHELSYGVNPCTCNAAKPTPPAPTDAEVREAREALAEDIETYNPHPGHDPKNYYARVRWWAVCCILTALDKAQGEVERHEQIAKVALFERDALRAENAAQAKRLAEVEDERNTFVQTLGCHPAFVKQEIERLQDIASRTPNADEHRQLRIRATAAEAHARKLEAQLDAIFRREDTQGG